MYEVIKSSFHRLARFFRVRNSHQLRGPNLLRTSGTGRGPKHFKIKKSQVPYSSDPLHSRW